VASYAEGRTQIWSVWEQSAEGNIWICTLRESRMQGERSSVVGVTQCAGSTRTYIWKFNIRATRRFAPHKSKKYTDLLHLSAHCSTKWVLPSAWLHQRNRYISKLMPRITNKRMENLHYEEFRNCKHHRTLLQLSTEGRWDGPDMGIKEFCRKSWQLNLMEIFRLEDRWIHERLIFKLIWN